MKILILTDKMKYSLSAKEFSINIKEVLENNFKNIKADYKILADGGEGSLEAIYTGGKYKKIHLKARNPEGYMIDTFYLVNDDTAIIEMSKISGLMTLKDNFNLKKASTKGTGEIIKDALNRNIRKFIITVGGSATNDLGIGMLRSLGFKFKDKENNEIEAFLENMPYIEKIDFEAVDKRLNKSQFLILSDVKNPLYGKNGASYVYAAQKGAKEEEIPIFDQYFRHFHDVVKKYNPKADAFYESTGAAGGIVYSFLYLLNAKVKSGIDEIMKLTGVEEIINDYDLVITGEGKIDEQSLSGKLIGGVSKIAKKYDKPVIAFCGVLDIADYKKFKDIDCIFPIIATLNDDAKNKKQAIENLRRTVYSVFKALLKLKNIT